VQLNIDKCRITYYSCDEASHSATYQFIMQLAIEISSMTRQNFCRHLI